MCTNHRPPGPSWHVAAERELADSGITLEELRDAQQYYANRGLNLARVKAGWRVFGIPSGALLTSRSPVFVACWGCVGTLVADREEILARYQRTARGESEVTDATL